MGERWTLWTLILVLVGLGLQLLLSLKEPAMPDSLLYPLSFFCFVGAFVVALVGFLGARLLRIKSSVRIERRGHFQRLAVIHLANPGPRIIEPLRATVMYRIDPNPWWARDLPGRLESRAFWGAREPDEKVELTGELETRLAPLGEADLVFAVGQRLSLRIVGGPKLVGPEAVVHWYTADRRDSDPVTTFATTPDGDNAGDSAIRSFLGRYCGLEVIAVVRLVSPQGSLVRRFYLSSEMGKEKTGKDPVGVRPIVRQISVAAAYLVRLKWLRRWLGRRLRDIARSKESAPPPPSSRESSG